MVLCSSCDGALKIQTRKTGGPPVYQDGAFEFSIDPSEILQDNTFIMTKNISDKLNARICPSRAQSAQQVPRHAHHQGRRVVGVLHEESPQPLDPLLPLVPLLADVYINILYIYKAPNVFYRGIMPSSH